MAKRRFVYRAVVFLGAMGVTGWAVAQQDKPEEPQERDAMMEAWMKAAQPGEHHEHLAPLEGKWNTVVKHRMSLEEPWEESTGTAEFKWIMGGRFLLETVRGEMEGETFEGMGIIGYDNVAKKHTSMWIDNMGTQTMISTGTCDESGKVITYRSEFTDPMTGERAQQRGVQRMISDDKCVYEMYSTRPDGKEFKSLEVTYTRR